MSSWVLASLALKANPELFIGCRGDISASVLTETPIHNGVSNKPGGKQGVSPGSMLKIPLSAVTARLTDRNGRPTVSTSSIEKHQGHRVIDWCPVTVGEIALKINGAGQGGMQCMRG